MSSEIFLNNVNQANLMLLSGKSSQPTEALFFHSRSYGDYTGLFEKTCALLEKGQIKWIVVANNEGERFNRSVILEANPGKIWCIDKLLNLEIPPSKILVPQKEAFHTKQENEAFLDESRRKGWTSAIILTQPHQLLRAMLGMVKTMEQCCYWMEIYTAAPDFTPWHEMVKGNQGLELKPRWKHIEDEISRILRYQASGDLTTFEQLFTYLKNRETGNLLLGPRVSQHFSQDLPPLF